MKKRVIVQINFHVFLIGYYSVKSVWLKNVKQNVFDLIN